MRSDSEYSDDNLNKKTTFRYRAISEHWADKRIFCLKIITFLHFLIISYNNYEKNSYTLYFLAFFLDKKLI